MKTFFLLLIAANVLYSCAELRATTTKPATPTGTTDAASLTRKLDSLRQVILLDIAQRFDAIPYDVNGEVPAGVVDGTNTVFNLLSRPVKDSENIYVDGKHKVRNVDYTADSNGRLLLQVAPTVSIVATYKTTGE